MQPPLIISALLFTATQAAPNSYLEKAKAILARSNVPSLNWLGSTYGSSEQEAQSLNIFGTPTQQYQQDGYLNTAPQPEPAGVPEIALQYDPNTPSPPQPVPVFLQQNANPNSLNSDDRPNNNPESQPNSEDNKDKPPTPPLAHCYDYKTTCQLCWTDDNTGKRVCKDLPKNEHGQVCSKEKDSSGKPYCATPTS